MTLTLCNSGLTGSSSGSLASNRSNCSELNTEEFKDDRVTNDDVEVCDDGGIGRAGGLGPGEITITPNGSEGKAPLPRMLAGQEIPCR
jgi:hypothetical protein